MSRQQVFFFTEDTDFEFLHKKTVETWLVYVANTEGFSLDTINIIFCSDPYILQINTEYLGHNYYTDVITFSMMNAGEPIEADIFISVDTVKFNAQDFKVSFDDELFRVTVHGLLHLLGYGDKTDAEELVMRQKEDFYLQYSGNAL